MVFKSHAIKEKKKKRIRFLQIMFSSSNNGSPLAYACSFLTLHCVALCVVQFW